MTKKNKCKIFLSLSLATLPLLLWTASCVQTKNKSIDQIPDKKTQNEIANNEQQNEPTNHSDHDKIPNEHQQIDDDIGLINEPEEDIETQQNNDNQDHLANDHENNQNNDTNDASRTEDNNQDSKPSQDELVKNEEDLPPNQKDDPQNSTQDDDPTNSQDTNPIHDNNESSNNQKNEVDRKINENSFHYVAPFLKNDNSIDVLTYKNQDVNVSAYMPNILQPERVAPVYANFLQTNANFINLDDKLTISPSNTNGAKFLNYRMNSQTCEIYFNIQNAYGEFYLDYTVDNSTTIQSVRVVKIRGSIYRAVLELTNQPQKIQIKKMKDGLGQTIADLNEQQIAISNKEEFDPYAIGYYRYSQWTSKENDENVQIAFNISQANNLEPANASFQIRYFDNQKNLIKQIFNRRVIGSTQNSNDYQYYVVIPKKQLSWIDGIYLQNEYTDNTYKKIDVTNLLDLSVGMESLNNLQITWIPKNVEKEVALHYSNFNQTNIVNAKALVKSANPFEPWAQQVDLKINPTQQTLLFDTQVLPAHLTDFVITDVLINNEQLIHLGLRDNLFEFHILNKISDEQVKLTGFDVFKDEVNKNVYGSLKLDFSNADINQFRNKWILLEFSISDANETSSHVFEQKYKTVIKFEDFAKFGLNGFEEGVEYHLESAQFVSPYNLKKYSNLELNSSVKKNFAFHFDYTQTPINQYLNQTPKENKPVLINHPQLLSTELNLNKNDLFALVSNADENKDTILYSPQNFYAWLRYSTYVSRRNLTSVRRIKMIDETGQEIKYEVIMGKEILSNTLWMINDDHQQVMIDKDLDQFVNWDTIANETLFSFKFQLDMKKMKLDDIYNADFKQYNKSYLSATFSYADLVKLDVNQSLVPSLDFDVKTDSLTRNEQRLQAILEAYSFKIQKLANHRVRLIIQAKHPDVYLTDNPTVHYFANQKTGLLNDARIILQYPHRINQDINIEFQSRPLKDNILSISTKETILDSQNKEFHHPDLTSLFEYQMAGTKNLPLRRVFADDASAGGLATVRERAFSLDADLSSSNSILGRVNPQNEHDYRFYFITNTHVTNLFPQTDNASLDHDVTRKIKVNFRIPITYFKPINYEEAGAIEPLTKNLYWPNGFDAELEIVSNYRDKNQFWNFHGFRDNYSNVLEDTNNKRRIDMTICIIDLSDFFAQYDHQSPAYQALDANSKKIADYVLHWKELPMMQVSREAYHVNDYVNLNWFQGSFPVNGDGHTKDNYHLQRYREYIFAHSTPIMRIAHGQGNVANNAIGFPTSIIDATGGMSGSGVFDSQGNIAGLFTAAADSLGYAYLINGNEYDFYGDGTKPFNQASFYEKARLLGYLYPQRYDDQTFNEKGFWFI
ncbi:hypothetical protein OF376_00405 [Ureaplasma miroungigenitalium]|uniref:DUF31 domain-containing protein n=1 Tax=Ureaplasma miroungigenitalium TaxID=1042321 RepID=A0ABT3BLX5_9BACT|nr:hypothetical protein [Ureaplasma miroungigenitalium]MCV3728251.1 hypothetical protein [Ureaplasma miroungigenitalium]